MACGMSAFEPAAMERTGFCQLLFVSELMEAQDGTIRALDVATRATTLGEHAGRGALVVECAFPFSPSIHAKENVPQTRNLL